MTFRHPHGTSYTRWRQSTLLNPFVLNSNIFSSCRKRETGDDAESDRRTRPPRDVDWSSLRPQGRGKESKDKNCYLILRFLWLLKCMIVEDKSHGIFNTSVGVIGRSMFIYHAFNNRFLAFDYCEEMTYTKVWSEWPKGGSGTAGCTFLIHYLRTHVSHLKWWIRLRQPGTILCVSLNQW